MWQKYTENISNTFGLLHQKHYLEMWLMIKLGTVFFTANRYIK